MQLFRFELGICFTPRIELKISSTQSIEVGISLTPRIAQPSIPIQPETDVLQLNLEPVNYNHFHFLNKDCFTSTEICDDDSVAEAQNRFNWSNTDSSAVEQWPLEVDIQLYW